MNETTDQALAVDVILRDCGYGFAAHLLMSDGARRFQSGLWPTGAEAQIETMRLAREAVRAGSAA